MLKRIFSAKIVLLLILLGLFPPAYIVTLPVLALDVGLTALKLLAYIFVLLIFIEDLWKNLNKKFNVFLIALTFELLFATLIGEYGDLYSWLSRMSLILIMCFFFGEIMTIAPHNGIRCLYWYFSLITMINTITIFLFPNAMYQNNRGIWVCWFLGEDNSAYFYYILVSTFAMLYCTHITKRITLLALLDWAGAFVFVFHNDIATGIACQLIWLVLIVGYQFKLFRKLLKAQYALYIMLAGFVLLVLMRRLILEPVVLALGRDITLSGRTKIWDRTIAMILKRPVFGYGICDGDVYAGIIRYKGISMAHDWILNLGFAGGIVAVLIYIIQLIFAFREGKEFRTTAFYRCVAIGMIVIFIRSVTEGSNWEGYFLFPAMIAYSKEFSEGISSEDVIRKRSIRFTFGNLGRRSRLI